jgi:hypothetical protein
MLLIDYIPKSNTIPKSLISAFAKTICINDIKSIYPCGSITVLIPGRDNLSLLVFGMNPKKGYLAENSLTYTSLKIIS